MRFPVIIALLLALVTLVRAEPLSFADLKANEQIVIGYRSLGCFHFIERKYVVSGGEHRLFNVFELLPKKERPLVGDQSGAFVGVGVLSDRESQGLEAYREFLRLRMRGGCTTQDTVGFGYFRDGKQIGEEQFMDDSCQISGFALTEEDTILTPREIPENVTAKLFKSIVPPRLLEERIVLAARKAKYAKLSAGETKP